MARIDKPTEDFMKAVSGTGEPKPDDADLSLKPIRLARSISKGIDNPKKALGKLLVNAVINTATSEELNKQSELTALNLYRFLNEHYERRWWDWEPETIWKMLQNDHFNEGTPSELKDAVMALQVSVNTFAPFEHWNIFEKIGHALNFNHVDFGVLQPLEVNEAALAIGVLAKIRPDTQYDSEVLAYIATCAKMAGMVYLPQDMFPGVQSHLDSLNFDASLRDKVKNIWEKKDLPSNDAEKIQIERLTEIKDFLKKGGLDA